MAKGFNDIMIWFHSSNGFLQTAATEVATGQFRAVISAVDVHCADEDGTVRMCQKTSFELVNTEPMIVFALACPLKSICADSDESG
jgi:acyl CoA:acetate/3-ketoacid CoA transferase beta subunit